MKDIGLDWVEMKGKGLESVDAENLYQTGINLDPTFQERETLTQIEGGLYVCLCL